MESLIQSMVSSVHPRVPVVVRFSTEPNQRLPRAKTPIPLYSKVMLRVRFAPSPTGFLHVGSARTFIFNWLYARRNGGTVVLRLDDTDVERNTDASVNSIFEGLRWLDLGWDEEYKQSERLALHRQIADAHLSKGTRLSRFHSRPHNCRPE